MHCHKICIQCWRKPNLVSQSAENLWMTTCKTRRHPNTARRVLSSASDHVYVHAPPSFVAGLSIQESLPMGMLFKGARSPALPVTRIAIWPRPSSGMSTMNNTRSVSWVALFLLRRCVPAACHYVVMPSRTVCQIAYDAAVGLPLKHIHAVCSLHVAHLISCIVATSQQHCWQCGGAFMI